MPKASEATKREARRLLVEEGLTLSATASKVGIAIVTLRAWRCKAKQAGDDWDKERATFLLTKEGMQRASHHLLQGFYEDIEATRELIKADKEISPSERVDKLVKLTDSFGKASAAFARANPSLDRLAVATEVIKRLTAFIKERHSEEAMGLSLILEAFAKELIHGNF